MTSSFECAPADPARGFVAEPLLARGLGFEPHDASAGARAEPDLDERLRIAFEEGREAGRAELPWQEAIGDSDN